MDRFIRVNGKEFSFEEVAKALGMEVAPHLGPVQIHLCQRVDEGILVAKGAFLDNDDYPAMDLELELPAEKDSLPVVISRTEQPKVDGGFSDGYQGVRNFVYNRDGEYFMYSDVDSRADEVVDRDGKKQRVMVSGSRACDVEVYQENPWVRMMGQKDFEYDKDVSVPDGVVLGIGMVGIIRDDADIKKAVRGKPFEVVKVEDHLWQGGHGYIGCKVEGQDGVFAVYASQIAQVGWPEETLENTLSNAAQRSESTATGRDGREHVEIVMD